MSLESWPALALDLALRGSLVVVTLLALDLLVGKWLAARHRRALWLLAPLAFLLPVWLCLPLLPAARVDGGSAPIPPGVHFTLAPGAAAAVPGLRSETNAVLILWLGGAFLGAAFLGIRTARASREWDGHRFCTEPKLLNLLEDCRRLAEVRAPVGLIVSERVESPALLGWLRPKLLLPARWAESASGTQLRDVLLHELAHLRAADLAWSWIFAAARIVHWWNPLAHLATHRWQAAREDSADEFVLHRRPAARDSYDDTLLAFLQASRRPAVFGALGISENLHHLKQRIQMIHHHPRPVLPPLIAVLLLAALASLTFLRVTHAESTEADRKAAAVAAMTAWLQGVDAGAYAQSWTDASQAFRKAVTQPQWVEALDAARKPVGACRKRELGSVMLQDGVPVPGGKTLPGEFAIAQFRSSFTGLLSAVETVTFEREKDGVWRASGYFIKPN